ncbi:hypothetical protein, partial [Paenibacillus sp. KS1]|uniref:hypothetical protein n=1 Tax=Paenibacillus sp. KS1 TaxID=1849249 RepID=UPI0009F1C802
IVIFVLISLIYYRCAIRGPLDHGELKRIAEQRLEEDFGMRFIADNVTYRPNENRSFYKVVLHPEGHEEVRVDVSIPTDTGDEIIFTRWSGRGNNYADVLWGDYVRSNIEAILKSIYANQVFFTTKILLFQNPMGGLVIPDPYGVRVGKNYIKESDGAQFITSVAIFVNKAQFKKDNELFKIYKFLQKLKEENLVTDHILNIYIFNQGTQNYFNNLNKDEFEEVIKK